VKLRLSRAAVVLGLATLPLFAPPAPVQAADRQSEINAEIERLRDEVGEAHEEETKLLAELRVTQRRRKELDDQLGRLDGDIAVAEAAYNASSVDLDAAIVTQHAASEKAEKTRAELDEATNLLKNQALGAYMASGAAATTAPSPPDSVAATEEARSNVLEAAAAEAQEKVVERQKLLTGEAHELEAAAELARATALRERERVAGEKSTLESARAQQAQARAEVQAEIATEERVLKQVQAEKAKADQRIKELTRESQSITAFLQQKQLGQGSVVSGKGFLSLPLKSAVITSNYGWRTHPVFGDQRLHAGIDLKAATGTPVLATAAGVVVWAGTQSGYGNVVIIDHGNSLATLYAHLSRIDVALGQQVGAGRVIALSGATGYATGPHLHFEVRVKGSPVDPRNYL
jgi:murein DD-endopeptidase MepM/ murein hydrolase activator NlpD